MTDIIKHSYNGAIVSQELDGYVSLTDMAKASGKQVNDYLRLESTKAYLEGLSMETGNPVSSLTRIVKGKSKQQGTWAHPEVAIDFAQWCNVPFRIWANRVLRGVIAQPKSQSQTSLAPFWYQRLLLDHKTNAVPNGYFSIFREVIPLVADLETAGYVLPDNAVPDISVGKTWANYLRTINIVVEQVARQYPHTYPDRRNTQPCNCYPESLLPIFRQWFRERYKVDHLQRYMKTKDRSALPAVDLIVKSLMAAN
jgi:hypothetical protein